MILHTMIEISNDLMETIKWVKVTIYTNFLDHSLSTMKLFEFIGKILMRIDEVN